MSQAIHSRKSAILSAGRAVAAPVLAAIALAACGPDSSATSASDAAGAAPSAASAAAARAGLEPVAPSPSKGAASAPAANLGAAPVCPKMVEPRCPTSPASLAANTSGGAGQTGRRPHRTHHGRRDIAHRHWGRGSMSGEPSIQARDETGGGERFAGDYRMEEDSRSLYSRRYADERVVEREGPRCLTLCPGLHAGPRRFGFAGIDARGYLVWPGKVEY